MSIIAYVGLPGSGKSYSVVENQILPALKAGRTVVTNIPLNVEEIRKLTMSGDIVEFPTEQVQSEPDRIKEYVKPGCVFVLDEVWRLFPSGEKSNKVPEVFKSLLAEHRHMVDENGDICQIVLVVQDLANIGAFARRLVEQTFHHTKLAHVGMSGRFRVDIYHGPITGAVPNVSSRMREIHGSYKKEIYSLYKSHTMSESATSGANEKPVDTRANIFKRPLFYLGAPITVVIFWFGIHEASVVMNRLSHPAERVAVGGASQHAKEEQSVIPSALPIQRAQTVSNESRFRVVGWVLSVAHPEASRALLSEDGRRPVAVDFTSCFKPEGAPMRCRLEGFWYSETGKAWPDPSSIGGAPPIGRVAVPAFANNAAM